MTHTYRKQGQTLRLESSARGKSIVRLSEAGWAEGEADRFRCGPAPIDDAMPRFEPSDAAAVEAEVRRIASPGTDIERLAIVEGVAHHSIVTTDEERHWVDSTARIFVTLAPRDVSATTSLELGAAGATAIDLEPIRAISRAFVLPEGDIHVGNRVVRLAPWVAALLVRTLVDELAFPRGVRIAQSPSAGWRDGNGVELPRRTVASTTSPWPESFRPTYRFPPVARPMHVAFEGLERDDSPNALTVVALASSWLPERSARQVARGWIHDPKEKRVGFAEMSVDCSRLAGMRATDDEPRWYPFGAGAWGRGVTLPAEAVEVVARFP